MLFHVIPIGIKLGTSTAFNFVFHDIGTVAVKVLFIIYLSVKAPQFDFVLFVLVHDTFNFTNKVFSLLVTNRTRHVNSNTDINCLVVISTW